MIDIPVFLKSLESFNLKIITLIIIIILKWSYVCGFKSYLGTSLSFFFHLLIAFVFTS